MPQSADTVYVEAPARLHFGVLDLRGSLGRWFGGIGAAAPAPRLLLSAQPADTLDVTGQDASRAETFARRFLEAYEIAGGARIEIFRALPRHAGLGSGTQLALSVARALADLHGVKADAAALARALGRARRSAVGTWTFAGGGLVLEGGRRREDDGAGPLLARIPFPRHWQCVIAIPHAAQGVHGLDEEAIFDTLPRPTEAAVRQVAHLTMMSLLPSLAQADLQEFGKALTLIQRITGGWFATVQGGTYARGPSLELVRRLAEWRVAGVGQSSWGPTVYGIVDDADAAERLAERLSTELARMGGGDVMYGAFPTEGVRVRATRGQATPD